MFSEPLSTVTRQQLIDARAKDEENEQQAPGSDTVRNHRNVMGRRVRRGPRPTDN